MCSKTDCTTASGLHHGEAWDVLEVAEIERGHSISKMERSRADQQIFERNPDTFGFLLALNAAGQPRDVERHRMYWHILAKTLDKGQSPLLLRRCFRTIRSMH